MNKETQSIITGLLGGLLVSITLSGRYTDYVKPGFKPMLLVAASVLIVVAIVSLVLALRADSKAHIAAGGGGVGGPVDHEDPDDPHAGHQHSTRAPWLVLLPVLVLLFVAPPALGSDTLTRGITCGTPPAEGTYYPSRRTQQMDPLPAGTTDLTMQEFISRSLYDVNHSTAGADARVTAFVARTKCDGDGYSLVRLKISCCAADAIAQRVHIDEPPPFPSDTWVTATIRAVKDTGDQANNYVPSATVVSMSRTSQPGDPYET